MPNLNKIAKPLSWAELEKVSKQFQQKATSQFLNVLSRFGHKHWQFKYGDEIEYTILKFHDQDKSIEVVPKSKEVLHDVASKTQPNLNYDECHFTPEMAKFQVEGKPARPFLENQLLHVEENMNLRRKILKTTLKGSETIATLASFPRSTSLFNPKDVFLNDPLARYLEKNLRERSVSNVDDVLDSEASSEGATELNKTDDIILRSGPTFGAFQVTLQAKDMHEALVLHDSLAVMCPIMLSLTASCPILNGYLVDSDTRWEAMHTWYDDRHSQRLSEHRHLRSRLCSIPAYISPGSEPYNNVPDIFNEECDNKLTQNGVDKLLARHLSMMCSRDPLHLFQHDLESLDDDTNILENMLASHWPSVKLKPALSDEHGWRVEFRVCDVQLTDFHNAALVAFLVLFSRISVFYNIDFRIPISLLDYNMTKASNRNASKDLAYWFQVNRNVLDSKAKDQTTSTDKVKNFEKITINVIINGKSGVFNGLVPLMEKYLVEETNYTREELDKIGRYLRYISTIAAGNRVTTARWMRGFVITHEDYKKDSLVTETIAYDLLKAVAKREETSVYI